MKAISFSYGRKYFTYSLPLLLIFLFQNLQHSFQWGSFELSCDEGQYTNYLVIPPRCDNCHHQCFACSGPSALDCDSCIANDRIWDASQKRCRCIPAGFYEELDTLTCRACSTMCSTCDGPTIDDCKSCVRSSVLRISDYSTHVGTCVCPPSSYMISNGYCGSCNDTCLTCSGPTEYECLSCKVSGQVINEKGKCVCPFGMKIEGNICKESENFCDETQDLNGTEQCLTCLRGYQFTEAKVCDCPLGFYLNSEHQACLKCNDVCKHCYSSSPNVCRECYDNMLLQNGTCSCRFTEEIFYSRIKRCVRPCPNGEGYNQLDDKCVPCKTANCQDCLLNPEICMQCEKNHISTHGLCVSSCPQGFFERHIFTNDTRKCEKCSPNCQDCSRTSKNCTSCANDHVLAFGGVCNLKHNCTQDQYYSSHQKMCKNCASLCSPEGCTGPGIENCKVCPKYTGKTEKGCVFCQDVQGFIMKDGVCVTTCGDGIRAGDEQCDDGNVENGDGCDSTCIIEKGYECRGRKPDACTYFKTFGVDITKNSHQIHIYFPHELDSEIHNLNLRLYDTYDSDATNLTIDKVNSTYFSGKLNGLLIGAISFTNFTNIKDNDGNTLDERCAIIPFYSQDSNKEEKRSCFFIIGTASGNKRILEEKDMTSYKVAIKDSNNTLIFITEVSTIFIQIVLLAVLILSHHKSYFVVWTLINFWQLLNLTTLYGFKNSIVSYKIFDSLKYFNFDFGSGAVKAVISKELNYSVEYRDSCPSLQNTFSNGFIPDASGFFLAYVLIKIVKQITYHSTFRVQCIKELDQKVLELGIYRLVLAALMEVSCLQFSYSSITNKLFALLMLFYLTRKTLVHYKERRPAQVNKNGDELDNEHFMEYLNVLTTKNKSFSINSSFSWYIYIEKLILITASLILADKPLYMLCFWSSLQIVLPIRVLLLSPFSSTHARNLFILIRICLFVITFALFFSQVTKMTLILELSQFFAFIFGSLGCIFYITLMAVEGKFEEAGNKVLAN